ncbi:MAG TPA: hypothetical protein VJ952_04110 [Opitutales bacterium]|nr:hypothetical protein [Opitutales bacterium]
MIDWEFFREESESILGYDSRRRTRGSRRVNVPKASKRIRAIGLTLARQHNGLCNLVYNMDRYAFLCR